MRCAYCHDDDVREKLAGCAGCRTRLHEGCWSEVDGRCPTLGCARRAAPRPTPAPSSSRWVWLLGASLCAITGGLTTAAGVVAELVPRRWDAVEAFVGVWLVILALLHLFVVPALWAPADGAGLWARLRRLVVVQLPLLPVLGVLLFLTKGGTAVALGTLEPLLAVALLQLSGPVAAPPVDEAPARRPDPYGVQAVRARLRAESVGV